MLPAVQSASRDTIRDGAHRIGPFLIRFGANSDHPFRNDAVPGSGPHPNQHEAVELVAPAPAANADRASSTSCPAPAVDAALRPAGFTVDVRCPGRPDSAA